MAGGDRREEVYVDPRNADRHVIITRFGPGEWCHPCGVWDDLRREWLGMRLPLRRARLMVADYTRVR
jgi:hypothetical protein